MTSNVVQHPRRARKAAKCPICGRAATAERAPFCSKRCADEDLARWLGGKYRIPVDEPPAEADEAGGDDETER